MKNKRLILTVIITILCLMNIFGKVGGQDTFSYFTLFRHAAFTDELSDFWKFIFMAPTGSLILLTVLHIAEPKSISIERNHLAIAGIIAFLLYLVLYGIIYLGANLFTDVLDFLVNSTTGSSRDNDVGYFEVGWVNVLYPILFLSYVLIHRYMSYTTQEDLIPVIENKPALDNTDIEDEYV